MEHLLADLRFALRSMRRAPLVQLAAALSLALGIASSTTIFSALDALLFRPLPYPDAARLVRVWGAQPERGWLQDALSVPDYTDLHQRAASIELAAWSAGSMNIADAREAERVTGTRATVNLLHVVGLEPALGRGFRPEDAHAGAPRVVVIGAGLWQRRFGARADVIGESLVLDGEPHEIVGVLRAGDAFPDRRSDIWTPLRLDGSEPRDRRTLGVVGRLRDGVTPGLAAAELGSIAAALQQTFPETNAGREVRIEPLADAIFNRYFRQAATICAAAVLSVLLIACANAANLLLARASGRERELALRAVLGAGRGRIVRQLLTESIVLALVSGGLGVLLSIWGVKWLVTIMPQGLPGIDRVGLDGRVLAFTAAISVLAGVVFGLAPALQGARLAPGAALRDGARGATALRGGRLRASLVVGELAMAVLLLVCAGLLIKGYRSVAGVDPGFRSAGIMTARVALPESGSYRDTVPALTWFETLRERVRARPGVQQVTLAGALPMMGSGAATYTVEGSGDAAVAAARPAAQYRVVDVGFMDLFGVTLLEGRDITAADRRDSPPVLLVNRAFAERHWPGESALGRRVRLDTGIREIVGVVADFREWGGAEAPPAMLFVPFAQRPVYAPALAVRSTLPDAALAALLRSEVRALDPAVPLYQVQSMESVLELSYQGERTLARLLAIFAGMALLLAVLGVYAVMAYSVAQRTQEVGIRMAVGADAARILRLMLGRGLALGLLGTALGLLLALGAARFLAAFLFGVSPWDPATFLFFGGLLLVAALAASAFPALRAARVDPLTALRSE